MSTYLAWGGRGQRRIPKGNGTCGEYSGVGSGPGEAEQGRGLIQAKAYRWQVWLLFPGRTQQRAAVPSP